MVICWQWSCIQVMRNRSSCPALSSFNPVGVSNLCSRLSRVTGGPVLPGCVQSKPIFVSIDVFCDKQGVFFSGLLLLCPLIRAYCNLNTKTGIDGLNKTCTLASTTQQERLICRRMLMWLKSLCGFSCRDPDRGFREGQVWTCWAKWVLMPTLDTELMTQITEMEHLPNQLKLGWTILK